MIQSGNQLELCALHALYIPEFQRIFQKSI